MASFLFTGFTEKEKNNSIEKTISGGSPDADFFLMIILSVLMATFGILMDSITVVIGSMLIAPMLYSVMALSLGIVMSDFKLISRSFYTILKAVGFSIAVSFIATLLFSSQSDMSSEIIFRAKPSIIYMMIAIIAGLAASFASIKKELNEAFPGVAISVALIPPLAIAGIGIAKFDWNIVSSSLLLFLVNMIGIIFSSMIIFSLMNFYLKKNVANEVIEKEEEKLNELKNEAGN